MHGGMGIGAYGRGKAGMQGCRSGRGESEARMMRGWLAGSPAAHRCTNCMGAWGWRHRGAGGQGNRGALGYGARDTGGQESSLICDLMFIKFVHSRVPGSHNAATKSETLTSRDIQPNAGESMGTKAAPFYHSTPHLTSGRHPPCGHTHDSLSPPPAGHENGQLLLWHPLATRLVPLIRVG